MYVICFHHIPNMSSHLLQNSSLYKSAITELSTSHLSQHAAQRLVIFVISKKHLQYLSIIYLSFFINNYRALQEPYPTFCFYINLLLFEACICYFSLFLKEKYISSLFQTKYVEKKFNLQLFFLPIISCVIKTMLMTQTFSQMKKS